MQFPDQPYGWAVNITGSAGAHKATMSDPGRFLVSSFHVGAVYHVNNWYGIGAGMDVFYNGAIDNNTDRSLYRKRPEGYSFTDKVRAGIALNNEFRFGILTVLLDWGVYVFNPSRNYYLSDHPVYGHGKRPLIYKSENPSRDEGWNYWRFGLRCRVWDNLYVQVTAKMHLHISEHIGFGVGYDIPFRRNVRPTAA